MPETLATRLSLPSYACAPVPASLALVDPLLQEQGILVATACWRNSTRLLCVFCEDKSSDLCRYACELAHSAVGVEGVEFEEMQHDDLWAQFQAVGVPWSSRANWYKVGTVSSGHYKGLRAIGVATTRAKRERAVRLAICVAAVLRSRFGSTDAVDDRVDKLSGVSCNDASFKALLHAAHGIYGLPSSVQSLEMHCPPRQDPSNVAPTLSATERYPRGLPEGTLVGPSQSKLAGENQQQSSGLDGATFSTRFR